MGRWPYSRRKAESGGQYKLGDRHTSGIQAYGRQAIGRQTGARQTFGRHA